MAGAPEAGRYGVRFQFPDSLRSGQRCFVLLGPERAGVFFGGTRVGGGSLAFCSTIDRVKRS